MKRVLKIIGVIIKDIFTSSFMKGFYIWLGVTVILMLLAAPALWLIEDVYTDVPYLNWFDMEASFGEDKETIMEYYEYESYRDYYSWYFNTPVHTIGAIILSYIFIFWVFLPILTPVFILCILLFVIVEVIDKVSDTIWNLKRYFWNLKRYFRNLLENN